MEETMGQYSGINPRKKKKVIVGQNFDQQQRFNIDFFKNIDVVPSINLKKSKSLLKNINIDFIKKEDDIFILYDIFLNDIKIGFIKVISIPEKSYSYEILVTKFVLFTNGEMQSFLPKEHAFNTLAELKDYIYNRISTYINIIKKWEQ